MQSPLRKALLLGKRNDAKMRGLASQLRGELQKIDAQIAQLEHGPKADRPRCGARTRAGGECQAPVVAGGDRCRMHGGGGVDWVNVERLILQNQRREAVRALRVAEALAGQGTRKFRWTIQADRR